MTDLFAPSPLLTDAQTDVDPFPLSQRLGSAITRGGFHLDDHWVWCGSPIRGQDGLYHLYASCWSKSLSFHPHWITNSQIVHAVASLPQGPYQWSDVALPARDPVFWDGRMTHNPSIHFHDGRYLLFYTGTTYDAPLPTAEHPDVSTVWRQAHASQRIGLATATSPFGPWQRLDQPILSPRPGLWDGLITTNPAVCVRPDGSILVIYKSVERLGGAMRLGIALAHDAFSPFLRLVDDPILQAPGPDDHVEDPCFWWNGSFYEMIVKHRHGGLYATSHNAIDWHFHPLRQAYGKHLRWDDGKIRFHPFLERPQVLLDGGLPTYLFLAAGASSNDSGRHDTIMDSCNIVIPFGNARDASGPTLGDSPNVKLGLTNGIKMGTIK